MKKRSLVQNKSSWIFLIRFFVLINSGTLAAQNFFGNEQSLGRLTFGIAGANTRDITHRKGHDQDQLLDMSQRFFLDVSVALLNRSNYTFSRQPTLFANYDYQVSRRLNIGVGVSYDRGVIIYNQTDFGWFVAPDLRSAYRIEYQRTNVAGRLLYNFIRTKHVEIYSGLRAGINMNTYDTQIEMNDHKIRFIDRLPESGRYDKYNLQLIYMGWSVELYRESGFNLEICAGQPYFLSFGVFAKM